MLVRPIEFGSPEYAAACELRRRFLRAPLGLELTVQDVECDFEEHHFGLFREAPGDASTLIGGLTGRPDAEPGVVRLRQVVVHDEWRSRGHGSVMLREAERLLAGLGFRRLMLYARGEAVDFYLRNGYEATGEKAYLIGLEHLRMEKAAPGA